MKIQYCSDLHLELRDPFPPIVPSAPILFLAGDICSLHGKHILKYYLFLRWISKKFERVLIVLGNHEYYHSSIPRAEAIAKRICQTINPDKLILLQCNRYDLTPKLRVVGCTLWTNPPQPQLWTCMNDFTLIGKFTIHQSIFFHQQHVKFLEDEMKEAKKNEIDLLVMTHHLPSHQMIHSKYQDHPMNGFFATNLDRLIQFPVRLWVCGHSHCVQKKFIQGVTVVMNCLGYPTEITGYQSQRIVDVLSPDEKK